MESAATGRAGSPKANLSGIVAAAIQGVGIQLRGQAIALASAPRELRLTYLMKWLVSYGYFSTSLMLTLLLSEDFGLADSTAGDFNLLSSSAATRN